MPAYPQLLSTLTATESASAGVYVIRPTQDARVYVGAAKHLGQACACTRHALRQGRHGSRQLQAYATAHGLGVLRFEVLALCSVGELAATKQRYLNQLQACDLAHGFNSLNPAGSVGQKMSAEARARLSAGKLGRPITPRTAEHQAKLAAAHRGRKRSPETCAAISAATRGKPKRKRPPQ